MRHLLFPKKPPTLRERIRAQVVGRAANLHSTLAEYWLALREAGHWWTDPAYLVLITLLTMPATTSEPGQPQEAIWWYIAVLVVSLIISVAMAPKTPVPKPNALADFDAPTAEEGRPICKIFGEMLVKDPNVLWFGDLSSKPIKSKGGKK